MEREAQLNDRLEHLAAAWRETPGGLGLLGLGSVGKEVHRLDAWSDLDFFLLCGQGLKKPFLENPELFSRVHPVDWIFRNTADGFKLLFSDGIFGEMAIFEPEELAGIPYVEGRWIWRDPSLPESLKVPTTLGSAVSRPESVDWALGEFLSCLYVGLCRYRRGEKLSAWRFVQGYVLDRFLELVELQDPKKDSGADRFSRDRRWEQRHPELSPRLATFLSGYESTPQSALALLEWAQENYTVNAGMAKALRALATGERF